MKILYSAHNEQCFEQCNAVLSILIFVHMEQQQKSVIVLEAITEAQCNTFFVVHDLRLNALVICANICDIKILILYCFLHYGVYIYLGYFSIFWVSLKCLFLYLH